MESVNADPYRAARLVLLLRQVGVTDNAVVSAMEQVPRDQFLPEEARAIAFEDIAAPIACGQTVLRPSVTGQLLQLADIPRSGARVFLVGLGSGYTAALLSAMGCEVYAIERYRSLFDKAKAQFHALDMDHVSVQCGDGLLGWPDAAPFDRIILTGTAEDVPVALMQQLAPEGQLVFPQKSGEGQRLVVLDSQANQLNSRDIIGFQPLAAGQACAL